MKRIDTPNRAADLFGAGKDGFRTAVPGVSSATEFSALWFNHVQEAIVRTIEAAGLALSDTDFDQFQIAVRSLSGSRIAVGEGTANAITADFTPGITALANGLTVIVRAAAANASATPSLAANATAAKTIVKGNGLALVAGDIAGAGHWLELQFDTALDKWVLQNPATGVSIATVADASTTVKGKVELATSAETAALADTIRAITPSTLLAGVMAAVNAAGSAPMYIPRAWVNFNARDTGTPTIRSGGNVSSITDNATGDFTVNFTYALPDADYIMTHAMCNYNAAQAMDASIRYGSGAINTGQAATLKTTSACRIYTCYGNGNGGIDPYEAGLAFHR
jgi:hypothetical protein